MTEQLGTCWFLGHGGKHEKHDLCSQWRPVEEGTATPPAPWGLARQRIHGKTVCTKCGKEAGDYHPTCAAEATPSAPTTPQGHLAHVQRFLLEMYQTMVDPLDEFKGNIEQLCALLLQRAREDREALHVKATPSAPGSDQDEVEYLRQQLEQIELDTRQTDIDLHTAHKENGELWEQLQAARQRIAELERNGKF